MKKTLTAVILAAVIMALSTAPVLADGHCGRGRAANYTVCTVESCVLTGLHTHNSKIYSAHYYGDGHKYHEFCEIEDCALAGYHSHDGEYCFGHNLNDGHDYHGVCAVSGCTAAGYHEHNGAHCFQRAHR